MPKLQIRKNPVPEKLAAELAKFRGKYTDARSIYQLAEIDHEVYVGAFGDGANASYEWFIWDGNGAGKLQTSDAGYGSDTAAIRAAFSIAITGIEA